MSLKEVLDYPLFGQTTLEQPLAFILKVLAIYLFVRIVVAIIKLLFRRANRRQKNLLDQTSSSYLQRILVVAVYIIGVSSILGLIPGMSKVSSSILASAGILTAAIGLASQEALSNFIGGVFIIVSKPFRIGDFIKIDDTAVGTVKEITLRHTVILNNENRLILIPNSKINSNMIINSTMEDSQTCAFVEVGVSYNEDLNHVMDVMRDEIMKHPSVIDHRSEEEKARGETLVKIKVLSLDDSSIKLRAWVWAATSGEAFEMKCDLLKSIKERFDQEKIEIPYPYYNQIIMKQQ